MPKSRGKHELQRKGLVLDVGFMRPLLVWRGYWIDGENVMSKVTGGQAFPRQQWEYDGQNNVLQYQEEGMTLRDYFAAKAMQAMLCAPVGKFEHTNSQQVSLSAYYIADEMLEARNQ